MPDVRGFLKTHRWSVAMIVFTAVFYVLLALPGKNRPETPAEPAARHAQFSREELREREQRFQRALEANPRLFGLLTMGFTSVLFLGLFTDAALAVRRFRGKPWISHGASQQGVPWGFGAVLHVFLLLFFLEAVVLSLEMAVGFFVDLRALNRDMLLMTNSLVRDVIAVAVIVLLVKRRYRTPLSDIGFTARDWKKNLRTGLVGYVAIVPPLLVTLLFMALIAKAFHYEPPPQPVVAIYLRESAPKALLFFTVFVAVCGPIMEELFFRGFAYKALRTRYGVNVAMTVTALLFSLLHMTAIAFVPIFLLGLFLNYLYEKTSSLIPGMAAHMTHNLVMVGCTMAFKSLSS